MCSLPFWLWAIHGVARCAQRLESVTALSVSELRTEVGRDAIELLERVRQQHELAFGVYRAELHTPAIPGGPDLDTPIGRVDIHVCRHAHRLAACLFDDGKRQHGALVAKAQAPLGVGLHRRGFGNGWIQHGRASSRDSVGKYE